MRARSWFMLGVALGLWALAVRAGFGAPPPGADPNSPIARWVRQLETPEGWSCCSVADCRPVHVRLLPGGRWQAFIDRRSFGTTAPDAWVDVPNDIVRGTKKPGPAPNGTPWACWYAGVVRCLTLEAGF